MNIKLVAATIGTAAFLSGAPAFASAAPESAPVHINSFQSFNRQATTDYYNMNPGFATVSFTNAARATATEVVFAVLDRNNAIVRFDDVGTFTPGVTIKHQIPQSPVQEFDRIDVERVAFADGSTWENPNVSPAPQALLPGGTAAKLIY